MSNNSRVACFVAAFTVMLAYTMIFPVKGHCAEKGCENEGSSNSISAVIQQQQQPCTEAILQQQNEQVQRIHELLSASFQQLKNQQDTFIANLQVIDRRSQEQDIHMNQMQSIYELLNVTYQQMKHFNALFQQMKKKQDSVVASLKLVGRRLNEHDVSIKNQIRDSWKLSVGKVSPVSTTGVSIKPEIGADLGDSTFPLPALPNWIVLTQRFDGSLNFNRNWTEYKNGFGDATQGEFWLGNEEIHRLTKKFGYTLRIELYIGGTWLYADYATFSIDSEKKKYALHLSGFSGTAGDSLTNTTVESKWYLNGMKFSTWDADNDKVPANNCALQYGAGWWFNGCWYACLTCPFDSNLRWYSLRHLESGGVIGAARMMMKSV